VRNRRGLQAIGLSFLDLIFCGFGAVILLFVITKAAQPMILETTTQDLSGVVARLERELQGIRGETEVLNRSLTTRREQLAEEKAKVARLQGDLSDIQGRYAAAKDTAAVQNILEGRLARARQELTEEMQRLLAAMPRRPPRDRSVGGIPVDSEYIIFVIDTSGSMYEYAWNLVQKKMQETLEVYPQVKGIQVMNDMGTSMFSQYAGQWIPDSPARRRAIVSRLRGWHPFSNSSPVEGIEHAIRTFYAPDKRISIYVFGDEFTGGSIDGVVRAVDGINREDAAGKRRVRIHAVGFPVQFARPAHLQTTGIRFATLMRILCQKNGGTFVGLNDFRP
jgi:hypothetical protein